jgi:NAD(P)-dependent dehydrogenase (short-subunit alcohol dehydrogenase family)
MSDTTKQTVLVTGASDGLGRGVATELARRGYSVVAHGRDPKRSEEALARIRADSGSEDVELELADLANLGEVRALARRVAMSHPELSVLVNNAGIGGGYPDLRERQESSDGFELRFAVNYLAGWLLASELLPTLRQNAPARIVNVASGAQAPLDFDDVMLERDYDGSHAYAQSKLAQVMHARELAERVPEAELTAYSLHPATFMPTKIVIEEVGRTSDSLETGIEAVVKLVTEQDPGAPNGAYFNRTEPAEPHPLALDANARVRLWRLSEELTGAGPEA